MANERRFPRKIADTTLSIQMEPNNDAIVLDVSDGGLGFRALSPLTRTGTICFSFSDNGQRIESRAELVWTDTSKKTGGLSFATLPRANRERIRNWVDRAEELKTMRTSPELSTFAQKEPTTSPTSSQQAYAAAPSFPGSGIPAPQTELPGFALFDDGAQRAQTMWDPGMSVPNSGTKFLPGFLTGAVASTIFIGILLLIYGNQTNNFLNRWRTTIGSSLVQQTSPPAPPAAPLPALDSPVLATPEPPLSRSLESPEPSDPLGASTEDSGTSSSTTMAETKSPSAPEHVASSPLASQPKTADPGEEDLALAQPYLRNRSGPAGSAVAVRLLWAAVEKGNVQAEITLADLYSRGDGVTKNCDQARVLLRAAAEKGSSEASQELSTIIRTSCR